MKINVLGIVKGVSELAVSAGAGAVVGNLVRATTPQDLGRVQKVMVGVGGYAIGAVLGDLSARYVSAQIDGYAERINEIIHPNEAVEEVTLEAQIEEAAMHLAKLALSEALQEEVDKSKAQLDKKKESKSNETE